jgi:enediyne biosynthesis protein E4
VEDVQPNGSRRPRRWRLALAGLLLTAIAITAAARWSGRLRRGGEHAETPDVHPVFKDVTAESGITFQMAFLPAEQGETFRVNLYDHGCGVVVGDYDGDGDDDIYFLNQLGSNALFRNDGQGHFDDVTDQSGDIGLSDRICVGGTFADYDNDGDQDLYVTSTRGGNVLFNNDAGVFRDVTEAVGLTFVGHSQTAAFFDYDNDGDLDLFLTNTAHWTSDEFDKQDRYYPGPRDFWVLATSSREPNVLYANQGDGTFTNVTEEAGLAGRGWGGDVAVFDYDDNGTQDLLVTNMFGQSQLYRNNDDGTFIDVTNQVLGATSWGAIGSKAFDFNNDGRLDLLIADMHSDMWMPWEASDEEVESIAKNHERKYQGVSGPYALSGSKRTEKELEFSDAFRINYKHVVFGNTLYKNEGDGRFSEMSDAAGVESLWPWGVATGDFDNDGDVDVFLPTGMGYPYFYWHNYLLVNVGNEKFVEASEASGVEPPKQGQFLEGNYGDKRRPRSSRCAAVADFDGDGRLDMIVNNFNDAPYYYRNDSPRQNYIALRLTGAASNRDALGARVEVHVGSQIMVRQVESAGGYLSQSSKTIHFGLGQHETVDAIEIRWPNGARQRLGPLAINKTHAVREP